MLTICTEQRGIPMRNGQSDGTISEADAPDPISSGTNTENPSPEVLNRFWKRVAELTSRYHDVEKGWVGVDEVREWNRANRTVNTQLRRAPGATRANFGCRPVPSA